MSVIETYILREPTSCEERRCCTIAIKAAELGPSAWRAVYRGGLPLRTRVQLHTMSIISLRYYHSNSPLALWNRYLSGQHKFMSCGMDDLLLLVCGQDAILQCALPLVLDALYLVISTQHIVDHLVIAVIAVIEIIFRVIKI